MRLKDWLLTEAGHFIVRGKPIVITVMFHGRPLTLQNVTMVDPRFEFQNIPKPKNDDSHTTKFLGEIDYSLPIVNPRGGNISMWLASRRDNELMGTGFLTLKPVGYPIPEINWADHALIIDVDGRDLLSTAVPAAVAH